MANIPQLDHVLPGPAVLSVNEMCEMAPGIPWSNLSLDDMLNDLHRDHICSTIHLSPPVGGITRLHVSLFQHRTKVKKERVWEIAARVTYYCGHQNENPGLMMEVFPMVRAGLKAAIEFLKTAV